MSAVNAFDRIAPLYDRLHRLVFGDALDESQVAFLGSITKGSNVLMLGGGTGKALEAFLTVTEGCKVWYVEASSVMIARAKERVGTRASNVKFIHGTEELIPNDVVFDAAITGFFLDLFGEEKVGALARNIGKHLRKDGIWLITDFVYRGKWWQKALLWSMYSFFVATCRIEARRLPAWEHQVSHNGFRQHAARSYFRDFIKSSLWLKSSEENYI